MDSVLIKLAKGEMPTEQDIITELYELCDRLHSSQCYDCPIYKLNGETWPIETEYGKQYGCDCFKDGTKMIEFIRKGG